jgi:hypothetical protein
MDSFRCTPLTFLLAGFVWLLLSSLAGVATLLGLVYGTPLPSWLRLIHAHAALIGGLLQLVIGGWLASMVHASDGKQNASRSALFLSFNAATLALLVCFSLGNNLLAGLAGLVLLGIVASLAKPAWEHLQEELSGTVTASWVYGVALAALLIGLAIGAAMSFGLVQQYYAHARLLHLHLILLGFFTVIVVAAINRLLPLVLNRDLFSMTLGRTATLTLLVGFACLIGGFVTSSLRFELGVGVVLVLAASLFAYTLMQTWWMSGSPGNAASDHLLIAGIFLFFTTLTALFVGANYLTDPPTFPIGSLHVVAYTHMALLGFMINAALGALSHGIPILLAEDRVPNNKRRGPYLSRLVNVMDRWRAIQLIGISLGTMGLAVVASLTWSVPLGSLTMRIGTWTAAGLLLTGLTVFAAKLAWAVGLRPEESSAD